MSDAARLPRLGALDRWRRELYAGGRGDVNRPFTWVDDDLLRAAGAEARALELWHDGLHEAARCTLAEAAEYLYNYDPALRPATVPPPTRPFKDVRPHPAPQWGIG